MNTRKLGLAIPSILLALLTIALLWPPGPYSPRAYAQEQPPSRPRIFIPQVSGGRGTGAPAPTPPPPTPTPQPTPQPSPPTTVPDLRFTPDTVTLAPGDEATISVRVEPAADLRGATFELPGVQDGVSSSFEAAADGTSGTLTLAASDASEAAERMLDVQGRSGLDSTKTWVGALRIITTATTTAKTIFVDAVNGKDTNAGTQAAPLKTIKHAFTKVVKGDTVKLLPGGYGPQGSRDTYPLLVPNGVTLAGTLAANGAKQTFLSPATSAEQALGLTFAGDAAIKDLELNVFGTAVQATKGKLTLSNLNFILNGLSLDLRGTAQATLKLANVFLGSGQTGVSVGQQGHLTMVAGEINGNGSCQTSVAGIIAGESAQVTLKDLAQISEVHGRGLHLDGSATGTLQNAIISRHIPNGCTPAPSVSFSSTSLTIIGGHISSYGGNRSVNILTSGSGLLALDGLDLDSSITSNNTGIGLGLETKLSVTRSDINNHAVGIDARFNTGSVTVTDSRFSLNAQAILTTSGLKLRASTFEGNTRSIDFTGTNVSGDLGTDADPGRNTIVNGNTADPIIIGVNLGSATSGLVSAVGNTWTAALQGSDINGHYPHRLEAGPIPAQFERRQKNYYLPNANTKIQF